MLVLTSCVLSSAHRCINNASPAFPSNFKKALEEFDVNEDGLIDYQEFGQIDARYPLVLFPAFRLQDVMQRNSLGKRLRCAVLVNSIVAAPFHRILACTFVGSPGSHSNLCVLNCVGL
jgi:hypothetical protein